MGRQGRMAQQSSTTDQMDYFNSITLSEDSRVSLLPLDQITIDLNDEALERIVLENEQFRNRQRLLGRFQIFFPVVKNNFHW